MNNHIRINHILVATLILMLVITACGSNINSPLANIKTGPTQTVDIQVPMPKESPTGVELNLEFVAGKLILSPGASGYLASGTATFNAVDFEPKVEGVETSYLLRVGDLKVEGISTCPDNIQNTWDLQLANVPMSLNIRAGAYEGNLELGGLSLEKLEILDGGSDFKGAFSSANKVEMSSFTYHTGAGATELRGLANANFTQMTFTSGPGSYTLVFDGDLQCDAKVMVESRLSNVNIIIPEGVTAQVNFDGSQPTVKAEGGWEKNDDVYTLSGNGPTITIIVKISTGTLNLKTE